ncbi:MAG: PorV/PorQ family protein [Gemmatimonadetes bacterium]|nr:PorV/PorQ family protein [Gemmatimonadota bacterium]
MRSRAFPADRLCRLGRAVVCLVGLGVGRGGGGEPAQAQTSGDGAADFGATFLLVPVGGRAAALGQAAIADGGSSEAAFWNPAGLALMEHGEVAAHHAKTFISSNTALSAYFRVSRVGIVGVSAYLVDYGSQEVTIPGGPTSGKFSPKNVLLLASYATRVGSKLGFGVNYKLIQFRQDCSGDCRLFPSVVGTTHGIDVGLQFGRKDSPLRFGVAVRHAGFRLQLEDSDQADPLPTRLEFGVVYRVLIPPPSLDAQPLDARVLLDIENRWGEFHDPRARIGVELGYLDLIRLRTGYAFIDSETRGPSVGLGVRFGRLSVDFSRVFYDSSNFDEPVYISLRAGI